jgi:radical SAM superfamily enzyme YgiQ (UPF0313 family)
MKALLVQPPFAQLNAPYPAIHYLEAFLRERGVETACADHSIELYRSLFSREGLEAVFEAARAELDLPRRAGANVRFQLERYLSYEGLYLEWVGGILEFLSGQDPAFAHRLAQAVELPRGMRAARFLEARGGRIAYHEAAGLATAILEDLGDLVAYAYDPSFGTVRYGERIAASARRFAEVRSALEASPLLQGPYERILQAAWRKTGTAPDLLLVSIPFPGSLLGALACAASARRVFGGRTRVLLGGGYVSTELRGIRDPGLFDFCDYLCFDSGYGSIASILEVESGSPRARLFRTMYREDGGIIVAAGFDPADEAGSGPDRRRITRCDEEERLIRLEAEALASVHPDYSGAGFGRYLRVADSENPMHRLWSDSPWLKYGLARGCYWARCSFCDTGLEYVSRFVPAAVPALMAAAAKASERTGLRGIHFVDEAMPMHALLAFARANRARAAAGEAPFHFWGNARFDSSWTEDRCEFLAASGLVAVSGGIEIATEAGLAITEKGFDLPGLVRRIVAMRRAGLLVHAYLIYGFPGQSSQDIVDSAEVCRQLFAAGLLDSGFWHRFVLTRHSGLYREWLAKRLIASGTAGAPVGEAPAAPAQSPDNPALPFLKPLDGPWDFADNDLSFEGEEAFDEFDAPLATTLETWMVGEALGSPAAASLREAGLKSARESGAIAPALVERLVARAEAELDEARPGLEGRAQWIAGEPLYRPSQGGLDRLTWAYRGELRELLLPQGSGDAAARILVRLAGEPDGRPFSELAAELAREGSMGQEAMAELRGSGLVVV